MRDRTFRTRDQRNEAHRQSGAAQRSVIVGIGVCAVALIAVWMIVGPTAETPVQTSPMPVPGAAADAEATDEAQTLPAPAPDATITLVSGELAPSLVAADFAEGALLNFDLALPVSLPESGPLWARVLTEGREPLMLDGVVRGGDRNAVRLEVPAGWLAPGTYLIEIKTPERSHLPLRRFAFSVE